MKPIFKIFLMSILFYNCPFFAQSKNIYFSNQLLIFNQEQHTLDLENKIFMLKKFNIGPISGFVSEIEIEKQYLFANSDHFKIKIQRPRRRESLFPRYLPCETKNFLIRNALGVFLGFDYKS